MVDIKFIAKKAGVSIATVSRVLNGSKHVSETLRQRVMEEVRRYNYRPNTLARGLIMKKTHLVGVVMPNVSDLYHAGLLSGIERAAEASAYNVIVSNVYADFNKQIKSFEVFQERQIDGILLLHENTPEELKHLCSLTEVPVVLASINVPGATQPRVGIDDQKAAFDVVSYLIRIGHRRVAGIFGEGYTLGRLRREGYREALQKAGIPLSSSLEEEAECSIQGGGQALQKLMHQPILPTAIFCVSDELAIGAIDQLDKLGYSVPEDVSVFGFDNITISKIIRPRLSTVNQPVEKIGERAMQLLISLMQAGASSDSIILGHDLVLRDSCKSAGLRVAR